MIKIDIKYLIDNIPVECSIVDTNIHIKDSYRIRDDKIKKIVIEKLLSDFPRFAESRSMQDILNEWKTHNILYNWKFQRKRTADVDIELRQSKFLRFCYKLFIKIFREK